MIIKRIPETINLEDKFKSSGVFLYIETVR